MVNVVPETKFSWESQAVQYAPEGPPGITLEQHNVIGTMTVVDCLLYRDEDGQLLGIFNHYNDHHPLQDPGTCNIWVKPDCVRQGIGSELLREAWHRWHLEFEDMIWTPTHLAWIDGLVGKGLIDADRTRALDEDLDAVIRGRDLI